MESFLFELQLLCGISALRSRLLRQTDDLYRSAYITAATAFLTWMADTHLHPHPPAHLSFNHTGCSEPLRRSRSAVITDPRKTSETFFFLPWTGNYSVCCWFYFEKEHKHVKNTLISGHCYRWLFKQRLSGLSWLRELAEGPGCAAGDKENLGISFSSSPLVDMCKSLKKWRSRQSRKWKQWRGKNGKKENGKSESGNIIHFGTHSTMTLG